MPIFATTKDYLFIARRLRDDLQSTNEYPSGDARATIINSIYAWAEALSADNPNFDRGRFLINCGLSTPKSRGPATCQTQTKT